MKVWSLVILGAILVAQVNAAGSDCGIDLYFLNPVFTVSSTPSKGATTTFTLTGKTPLALTLFNWDIFTNFNGAITSQYDLKLTGNYTANSQVTVTYPMAIPSSAQSGYYNVRFMLQNSQYYYINCWTYSYFLSG